VTLAARVALSSGCAFLPIIEGSQMEELVRVIKGRHVNTAGSSPWNFGPIQACSFPVPFFIMRNDRVSEMLCTNQAVDAAEWTLR
jgi:hypothetical protein